MLRVVFVFVSIEATLRLATCVIDALGATRRTDGSIVCVGDSNTFGVGAPERQSWPDQLRQRLESGGNPIPVVNLAFPGLGAAQAIERLAINVAEDPPRVAIVLVGINDRLGDRVDSIVPPTSASFSERIDRWAGTTATWRIARTAWHVARGELAREEFGGSERTTLPEPSTIPFKQWETSLAQAESGGVDALFAWLTGLWRAEVPALASRAFERFVDLPEFASIAPKLRFHPEIYRFDLAILRGDGPPRLPELSTPSHDELAYLQYARGWSALAAGDLVEARRSFENGRPQLPGATGALVARIGVA